jgi:hypothetical protein
MIKPPIPTSLDEALRQLLCLTCGRINRPTNTPPTIYSVPICPHCSPTLYPQYITETTLYAPSTQQAILAKLKNIYNTLTNLGYTYSEIFPSTPMNHTMMISYILTKKQ